MVEGGRNYFGEKKERLLEPLLGAYDLLSGGLGIHLHAVALFAGRRELPKWAKESLGRSNSNFLHDLYTFGWVYGPSEESTKTGLEFRPINLCPSSPSTIKLFLTMEEEYNQLRRIQFRLSFGGEKALSIPLPDSPITDENEFYRLLSRAWKRGFIICDPQILNKIPVTDNFSVLLVNLLKNDGDISDSFFKQLEEIRFSDRFREQELRADVHKLASMMGLTEQLCFDLSSLGIPVSASYKPSNPDGLWSANWQKLFSEPMPTIRELYQQAHKILVLASDPKDQLIQYLLETPNLLYLV